MASFLRAFCLLSISYLATAQSTEQSDTASDATSAIVDPSASDLGILQLVTPTTHANQVAITALASLSSDAFSFYASYIQVDPFDFQSGLALAIQSLPPPAQNSLVAGEGRLINVFADGYTSLLYNPTSYLSRLHTSVSPWPSAFSSSLMSQATGILLGYESFVSQDVLSKNATFGPITPGMSIAVGPAVTSAPAASSRMGATQASQASQASQGVATAASTSPSKAAGVPVMTASPMLMINAVVAAVGVFNIALM